MKKGLISLLTAAVMMTSTVGAISASAAEDTSSANALYSMGILLPAGKVDRPGAPVFCSKCTAGKNYICLKWKRPYKATGYRVYYKAANKGSWKVYKTYCTNSSTPSIKIKGLKKGTKYKVKVRAFRKYKGKAYWGEPSDIAFIRTAN